MLFGIVWSLYKILQFFMFSHITFYKKCCLELYMESFYSILQLFITFSHIKFYKILQNQNVCKINFIKIFIQFYTILQFYIKQLTRAQWVM